MLNLELRYLDWDSEQLGIPCGLIDGTGIEVIPESLVLIDQIKKLIKNNKGIEFITIKLPRDMIRTVNALIQLGALLIDTELIFIYSQSTPKYPNTIPNYCRVKLCKEVDSSPFLSLAKEMHLSRFFLDSRISKDKAVHLWEISIKNHCEGFANQILVAYFNNEPCGIVTLKFKNSNQLFLHIVGVLKKYQGKKIGKSMLNKIIEWYAEDYNIYVETQSINIPAQIAYQKVGFKYHTLKYILHYWHY